MRYERVAAGEDDHLDAVWEIKEAIRREEGYLRQTWEFFSRSYTQNTSHLFLDDGTVAGFATVREDGYLLFLAIGAPFRGEGYGRRLVERIADEHETVTCHTRTNNEDALGFYEHVGFRSKSRIDDYYQDGDAAYYLVRGNDTETGKSLGDRIAGALRSDG